MKRTGFKKKPTKPLKRTPLRKKSKESVAKLKAKLWTLFSLYIRTRDNYTCVTCGKKGEGSGIHAGHYIPKSIGGIGLYFDEMNTHAQCFRCNVNLGGYGAMYHKVMIEKYGRKEVDKLWERKNKDIQKWTTDDYHKMIDKYTKLNAET